VVKDQLLSKNMCFCLNLCKLGCIDFAFNKNVWLYLLISLVAVVVLKKGESGPGRNNIGSGTERPKMLWILRIRTVGATTSILSGYY
jgi:hypothetical protein